MSNYQGNIYSQYRKKGFARIDGRAYDRQPVLTNILEGNTTNIVFGIDDSVQGRFVLMSADQLQPSHLGSSQNPLHFIPEAQPRNRSTSASGALTPDRIAQNLRPDEVLQGITAYSGAPVVNRRGEVIQGNGRAYALKTYYAQFANDPKGYAQAIEDSNFRFGFLLLAGGVKQTKIKKPVLVRMIHATDPESIQYGQFTQSDTEAIATSTTKFKSKARLLTAPVLKRVLAELTRNDDDDKSLSELIRDSTVLKVLIKESVIRVDDLENYTRNGQVNEQGVDFVSSILLNALFRSSDVNTADVFTLLPVSTQNALKKSTIHLLRAGGSKSINKEVSNAILGYREFLASGQGSLRSWKNQFDLQGNSPADYYSPLELAIIELLQKSTTQKEVVSKFRQYASLVNARPGTMFEPAQKGLTKREAAARVFGAKVLVDKTVLIRDKTANRSLKSLRKRVVKPRTKPANPAPDEVTSSTNNTMPTATKTAAKGENPAKKVAKKPAVKSATKPKEKAAKSEKKATKPKKKATKPKTKKKSKVGKKPTGVKAEKKARAVTAKKKAASKSTKTVPKPAAKKTSTAKSKAVASAPKEKKEATGSAPKKSRATGATSRKKSTGLKSKRASKKKTAQRTNEQAGKTVRVPNKKAGDRKRFIEKVGELSDKIHKNSATGEFVQVPVYTISRRRADKKAMDMMTRAQNTKNVQNVKLKV